MPWPPLRARERGAWRLPVFYRGRRPAPTRRGRSGNAYTWGMQHERTRDLGWKVATVFDILVVVAIGAALIALLILIFAASSPTSQS